MLEDGAKSELFELPLVVDSGRYSLCEVLAKKTMSLVTTSVTTLIVTENGGKKERVERD